MIRRPPRSTRTDTLFPYTTLFRSFIDRAMLDRSANSRLSNVLGAVPGVNVRVGISSKAWLARSEEHTSELQSLMRISYAVFCLKKKNKKKRCEPNMRLYTQTTRGHVTNRAAS